MPRFYIRLLVAPILLFTITLLLIRAQPYDAHIAHELRDLLPPASCDAPCFMGIQPGVTAQMRALGILKRHAWVESASRIDQLPYFVVWRWNGAAPEFFVREPADTNFMLGNVIISQNETVSNVDFSTRITLGDVLLTWGIPDSTQMVFSGGNTSRRSKVIASVALEYVTQGFWATGLVVCPYTGNFWYAPARIVVIRDFLDNAIGLTTPIDRKTFYSGIFKMSNQVCGT